MPGDREVALLTRQLGAVVVAGPDVQIVRVRALDDREDVVGAERRDIQLGKSVAERRLVVGVRCRGSVTSWSEFVTTTVSRRRGLGAGPHLINRLGGRGLLLLTEQVGDVHLVHHEQQHDDAQGDQDLPDAAQRRPGDTAGRAMPSFRSRRRPVLTLECHRPSWWAVIIRTGPS